MASSSRRPSLAHDKAASQRLTVTQPSLTGTGVAIAPGATGSNSVACPAGSLLTGGGHSTSGYDIITTDSFFSGNTWTVIGKNTGTTSQTLRAVARCTSGA
ncbi:hypothetical protein GCM10025868_15480 [Angustibacter aerolatus]|uniref:Uncharacterized protein n=1 Tax=Angustibacter aerolatus TaxID=1162965 RepID=A0ABQ6JFU4_9ACTN|nr:hypothetical protein [Angustibacter aerolatus]GMA86298.1 hypothetical protein GCM10025868_15480 [Angustibacter aerolatus]